MNRKLSTIFTNVLYPLVAIMSLTGIAGTAQSAAYIKFDGVEGESLDADHKGWIDVLSVDQGVHTSRSGDPVEQNLKADIKIDSSSVILGELARQGRQIGSVQVDLCEGTPATICDPGQVGDQHCYMKYELTDVIITSYQTGGSASNDDGDGRGTIGLTLKYETIKQAYTPAPNMCPTGN